MIGAAMCSFGLLVGEVEAAATSEAFDAGGIAAPDRAFTLRDRIWLLLVSLGDRLLRKWYGVREFTADPVCLLRLARSEAPVLISLSDGTCIEAGQPVADLHIWNERLPRFARGADFGWAITVRQRMRASLGQLARHLADDPAWRETRAVRACVTFGSRRRTAQLRRAAARFGFELVRTASSTRLHDRGEDLLIWAFIRAFNPAALPRHCLWRDRTELWISRDTLLRLYL